MGKTQETVGVGKRWSGGRRESDRDIEGGAGGTLTGKKGHLEAERGSGRDSTATYPPGHEPAPRVLGSGGHGLGLIAAGGPRGPRRLRGVSKWPRPADRGRGWRRLLHSHGPGLCHIRKFTRRRLTRCLPERGLLPSGPSPVLSLPSPLSPLLPLFPCLLFSPLCCPLPPPLLFLDSRSASTHLGLCMTDSWGLASGASRGPHPPSWSSASPCSLPA